MQQIEDKTSDFNRYYHQAGDTVDHMDAAYWQAMMRGLVATIATWAGVVPPALTPTVPTSPTASATMTVVPATTTATQAATPSAVATDLPQAPVLLPLAQRSRR